MSSVTISMTLKEIGVGAVALFLKEPPGGFETIMPALRESRMRGGGDVTLARERVPAFISSLERARDYTAANKHRPDDVGAYDALAKRLRAAMEIVE